MKTKRILATVLAIAMLTSLISVPVFAEEAVPTLLSSPTGEGYTCEDLGILVGPDEDGVTEEYLDTLAMRTQAAMVNLRLFGLEEAALAFDGEETFADAADATAYWQPILEYLKANPGMGWVGDEGGNFLPNDYITGQAFTKIILVALGYEYGLDFDWETTMDFAGEVGLTALADKADANLTVRDIAIAIIEALGFKTNSTTDVTLLTQLVLDGVIDEADAIAAGFEVEEPTLAIVNAYPSAINEVTIVLNMDVPEGTPITLKKGSAGYVVVEAIDGSTVTLTTLFNLPAGTYTVMVDTETAEFEVVAQHAVDLIIEADSVYLMSGQNLGVSMLDQYGDKMSLSGTNYSVFNQSSGYVFTTTPTTDLTIDVTEEPAEADEIIYVFVFDPTSMLTVSAELPVLAAPVLSEIVIGDVTNGDEDATMLFEDTADNILALEGIDQYGNPYEITFDDVMSGTIQILVSDESVIAPMSIDFEDGDMLFYANLPGSSIVTFILPSEAFVVSSEMITVYADPVLTSIEIAGPVEAVYAGEGNTFPVVGFDQYGDVIDVTTFDNEDIDYTTTVDLEAMIEMDDTNTVYFYTLNSGTTTVYYFLNGIFQGTFDVTVNEEAYPFQVVGITDIPESYSTDSYKVFSDTFIEVIDQYGRPVDMDALEGSGFEIMMTGLSENDNLRFDHIDTNLFVIYAEPGDEYGTDTFYLALYNPILNEITPESLFAFDVSHIDTADITTFTVDVIDDVLYAGDQDWDYYGQMYIYNGYSSDSSLYPYDNPLIIKAFLEDGTEVALALESNDIPSIIDLITYTTSGISEDYETRIDYPYSPTIYDSLVSAEGTCTVKLWINGSMVAETTVEVSLDDYVVASIEAFNSTYDYASFSDAIEETYFWPEDFFPGPDEWEETMIEMLGDSEYISWELRFEAMQLFTVKDQYDVEMLWYLLMEDEMLQLVTSLVESDDSVTIYFTLMTPDGNIYDSFTLIGDIF